MDTANDLKDIIETFLTLGAATVGEAQFSRGVFDCGLKPIDPGMRIAGPAYTVDMQPGDNLMLHYALLKIQPGDVLVADAKGYLEAGVWGDILTEQALMRGVAGLVINGSVRDATSVTKMGFPVFCRGLSIKGTSKQHPGKAGVPLCFGNVTINPGDIIVGDQDGMVVVPRTDTAEVMKRALSREEKERKFRDSIRHGKTTVELLGLETVLQNFQLT